MYNFSNFDDKPERFSRIIISLGVGGVFAYIAYYIVDFMLKAKSLKVLPILGVILSILICISCLSYIFTRNFIFNDFFFVVGENIIIYIAFYHFLLNTTKISSDQNLYFQALTLFSSYIVIFNLVLTLNDKNKSKESLLTLNLIEDIERVGKFNLLLHTRDRDILYERLINIAYFPLYRKQKKIALLFLNCNSSEDFEEAFSKLEKYKQLQYDILHYTTTVQIQRSLFFELMSIIFILFSHLLSNFKFYKKRTLFPNNMVQQSRPKQTVYTEKQNSFIKRKGIKKQRTINNK